MGTACAQRQSRFRSQRVRLARPVSGAARAHSNKVGLPKSSSRSRTFASLSPDRAHVLVGLLLVGTSDVVHWERVDTDNRPGTEPLSLSKPRRRERQKGRRGYRTRRETTTTPSAVRAVKRKKTLPLLSLEPASQSRRGRNPIPTARLLSQLTATAIEAVAELACEG